MPHVRKRAMPCTPLPLSLYWKRTLVKTFVFQKGGWVTSQSQFILEKNCKAHVGSGSSYWTWWLQASPASKAGHFLRSLSFSYEPALFLDTAAYLRGPLTALHGEEVCSQFLLGQAMIKIHEIESSIWGSISSVFRFWLKNSRGNTRTRCPAQGLLELEDIKGQPTPSGKPGS